MTVSGANLAPTSFKTEICVTNITDSLQLCFHLKYAAAQLQGKRIMINMSHFYQDMLLHFGAFN